MESIAGLLSWRERFSREWFVGGPGRRRLISIVSSTSRRRLQRLLPQVHRASPSTQGVYLARWTTSHRITNSVQLRIPRQESALDQRLTIHESRAYHDSDYGAYVSKASRGKVRDFNTI